MPVNYVTSVGIQMRSLWYAISKDDRDDDSNDDKFSTAEALIRKTE